MNIYGDIPQPKNDQQIPLSYAERFPKGYLDQDKDHLVLRAAIAFIVIDTVMVSLQFSARWIHRSSFRAEDYLALAGLAFYWGLDSSCICT